MDLEQLERTVLEATRGQLAPSASDRMRNQAAFLEAIQTPSPAAAPATATSSAAVPPPVRASGLGLTVGLVVGVIVGGVAGFGLGQRLSDESRQVALGPMAIAGSEPTKLSASTANARASTANRMARRKATIAEPAEVAASAVTRQSALDTDATTEQGDTSRSGSDESKTKKTRQRSARTGSSPKSAATTNSTLAAELAMLQRARRALNRDNGRLALGIVHSLDEEFSRGVLIEERSATRILALCQLERGEEARRYARQFLRLHSYSVYAERIRASCAGTP